MTSKEMTPEEMVARVLYRDGPDAGSSTSPRALPCIAGRKGGTSLEDYFDALRFGLPARRRRSPHRLGPR